MKKVLIVLLAAALLLGGIAALLAFRPLGLSTGRCLVAGDKVLLICDGSPIVLHSRSDPWLLEGLATGDEILVLHDGIRETYPAAAGVYFLLRLGGGSVADIPAEVIEQLTQLGWLS